MAEFNEEAALASLKREIFYRPSKFRDIEILANKPIADGGWNVLIFINFHIEQETEISRDAYAVARLKPDYSFDWEEGRTPDLNEAKKIFQEAPKEVRM